ncbi:N-acetylmuramoyl-L-alanine amidase [Brachyspira hyodysenteriae]|nr:N-acetylmuramoyl-L-alanine amidase [Brachyspira hyodysenteriae]MCZ9892655.1 N-acetylmuramoyl-L-alanine amidase [Brachyspira hyodysenteriae]MCZ9990199.1 N-acetylmuramoyl-L-alanine amidase [Brachyspira hyodysenteriae]MCZ9998570.1 N-acetylmuramoyl-L-alanine amidase [Brachyspira hyodysenteriae]MCZ9999436.1 N-acetylmuramoyl-L-alanine amidase [Brachyspira hyodysenteriae]MDA0007009.1 N-acetylmuramoyl-L-alanine amidase [Brachyspira hyodysenteriae]
MFKLIRFIYLLAVILVITSCNDENITPIRTRKIAPKVSSAFKSPAYNLRIKYIILHYTALNDDLSFQVLTDPGVSAHYLITTREDEPIYKLVDDNDRAWHAGITMFDNRHSMNDTSIGIEIVNLGFLQKVTNTYEDLRRMTKKQREELFFIPYDEYIEFEDSQIEKVAYLLKELIEKYGIKPYNILGHSDIAPYRKKDPGPKFLGKDFMMNII